MAGMSQVDNNGQHLSAIILAVHSPPPRSNVRAAQDLGKSEKWVAEITV
jgi:hypothetical protein